MKRFALTLTVVALAAAALPATAAATCSNQAMTQMFQQLDGDLKYYFVAPGGMFEGSGSWTTTGTTRLMVPDHRITNAGLKAALTMSSAATVTTGSFCVDATRQWMRFLYRRKSPNGSMKVEAILSTGKVVLLGSVTPLKTNIWIGSALVPLSTKLGLPINGDAQVKIRMTTTGIWDVDGISIDPYRRA